MTEVRREGTVVWVEDDHGRVLGATTTDDGDVQFTVPSGMRGTVKRVAVTTREEARQFARELLALVGEHDQ